nr:metal/formaldehyde-sensitive transcriptional repressor [Rhodanobacter sp. LX-100]
MNTTRRVLRSAFASTWLNWWLWMNGEASGAGMVRSLAIYSPIVYDHQAAVMSHIQENRKKLVARVRRIGGQVASLERAIAGDEECGAVLQQLAAVRGAVNGLILQVMEGHLRSHVADTGNTKQQGELLPVLAVLKSYLK